MSRNSLRKWSNSALQKSGGRGSNLLFMIESDKNVHFDLHIHSDISDGRKTIEQIGNEAEELGIEVISITDHDTIKPYVDLQEGKITLGDFSGKIIPGVEITTLLNGEKVHILLYDFDVEKANKQIETGEFKYLNRRFKIKRNAYLLNQRLELVNRLNLAGRNLDFNDFVGLEIPTPTAEDENKITIVPFRNLGLDVFEDIHFDSDDFLQIINIDGVEYKVNFDNFNTRLYNYIMADEKGKNYLSKFTNDKNQPISGFGDFNKYVLQVSSSPFAVDETGMFPSVLEIHEFAEKNGGIVIMAHLFAQDNVNMTPTEILREALEQGVDGIEVLHGFNTAEQTEILYATAEEYGLFITGGGDSHGHAKTRTGIPYPLGSAPGFDDAIEDNNFVRMLPLTTENVHIIGKGLYTERKNTKFMPGA